MIHFKEEQTPKKNARRKKDFDMEILEKCDLEKALNAKKKTLDEKTPQKTIYEIIDEKRFNESKVKLPKDSLTEYKTKFNVPQFIPLEAEKNIQQVGLE